jgi:6-phosphogluconolactonase
MRVAKVLAAMATLILTLMSLGCSHISGCPKSTSGTSATGSGGTGSGSKGGSSTCSNPGGGGGGSSNFTSLIYYMSFGQIDGAGLDTSGSLTSLSGFTPPTIAASGADAMVIVNKSFLYVPNANATLSAFAINHSNGALTQITGSPYTLPNNSINGTADSAVSDPKGQFLFVGSEGQGAIWVYQIDQTSGALTSVSGSPFTVPFTFLAADSLTVDASGQFLYAGQVDPNSGVMAFSIGSNGALTEVAGSPFHLGVAQLHADPAAEFLLGTAEIQDGYPSATDNHIYVFSIANNGVPTPVLGSPFTTTYAPYDFMILPNGNFVYTFGRNLSTGGQGFIEGFQLSASSGALSPMSGSPFSTLPTVFDCQVDQSGSEAFCANGYTGGTTFSVFSVNTATGALSHTGTDLTVTETYPFAATD